MRIVLAALALLTVLTAACAGTPTQTPRPSASNTPAQTLTPPAARATPTMLSQGTVPTTAITIACTQFAQSPNVSRAVSALAGTQIVVTLCADPSSGYVWNAAPAMTEASVLAQVSHVLSIPTPIPNTPFAIVSGKEVWTFRTAKSGTTDVTFTSTRNGQPGADAWSLKLTVTVR